MKQFEGIIEESHRNFGKEHTDCLSRSGLLAQWVLQPLDQT
jgi:hypothetical protein